MGLPRDARDFWAVKRQSFLIPSPHENNNNTAQGQLTYEEEEKILRRKRCGEEGRREGLKAAGIACVTSAIPTLIGVRVIPWAKANLKYTYQALIISTASLAAYFIVGLNTISECRKNSISKCSRQNSIKQYKALQDE